MDINIALTRAGIFAVVYALVLGIPFWIGYITKAWFPSTMLAIALASSGPFVYSALRRRAEAVLRKEQLAYQGKLLTISSTMMLNKDLERLLRTIVLSVVDTVKVKWAAVYLKDEKSSSYNLKYSKTRQEQIELPGRIAPETELLGNLRKVRLPLIGEEIQPAELRVGLAVPCFIEENLLGFLLLGDKPKGQVYDQSDVNVFALLSNQTALAIENCQFYAQERQQEHFRRIATLDHQMACMAHEIDNPIQALLAGIGSMSLAIDEFKGAIPEEKINYLQTKLERTTFNAQRITRMIEAVREFSKPTTGELLLESLQDILDSFNAITQPQLKHHNVALIQKIPLEPVWLRANKVEIEQVLVNLATNSIQAINEVWATGANTAESRREITLAIYSLDGKTLKIDLSDTGSGIKKELLEDIFLDFVTTKASSVGTGLGLAIARKIMHRHKGKIWAESEGENKGATFHLELPIPDDITPEEIKHAQEERLKKKRRIVF